MNLFSFVNYFPLRSIRLPVGSSSNKLSAQLLFPPTLSPPPFPQRFENHIWMEEKREYFLFEKQVKILCVSADLR